MRYLCIYSMLTEKRVCVSKVSENAMTARLSMSMKHEHEHEKGKTGAADDKRQRSK